MRRLVIIGPLTHGNDIDFDCRLVSNQQIYYLLYFNLWPWSLFVVGELVVLKESARCSAVESLPLVLNLLTYSPVKVSI